ncbi:AAA family ATPase [Brevundimonas sp. SL161]|uniref:AAA family ATPase n=1 Tax=Brevundimonas sp. SL161 TaxID=2804613 RepID=UPI003CF384B6
MNHAEKDAAESRTVQIVDGITRQEEAKAQAELAKLERAKLTTVVARPPLADPSTITLQFAMATDTATVKLEFLLDPFLPASCLVCFAGRGGTAKSSFLATMAAHVSRSASTMWVSVEELTDWIKVRHIKAGGASGTLAVVTAVASKTDTQGRIIGSSFNIYEHLEPSIRKAKEGFAEAGMPPLRLVVLDTAVGLTAWAKGESPNDDAAVKRLLGYLQALAEAHGLTMAFIQHSNKGKHEYFADTVAGASAWTNSPRLSFVHARDRREEHAYVMRVAKSNLTQAFGMAYKTAPVHVLQAREEGADSVLCQVQPGAIVWGEEQSMDLYEEATRRPKDDDVNDNTAGLRPPSLTDNVVACVVEMVTTAVEPVTRDMVQQRFGRSIDRRVWLKVDGQLLLSAFMYRVSINHGVNNRITYVRMTTPTVP